MDTNVDTASLDAIEQHRIRPTEQEALQNLRAVLQRCAAGELR